MCCGCGLEFLAPILAFDAIIGTRNFLAWTKRRGLQSFKAMGLISSVLCAAGGLIYAGWDSFPQETRQAIGLIIWLALMFYPPIEFMLLKREKGLWKRMLWRAPIVLCSVFWVLSMLPWFLYLMQQR